MNITNQDEDILKEVKRVVEKIEKQGVLPNTKEEIEDMFAVWNRTYKKNEKVTNCPTCRPKKFAQLKQTYDIFELKTKWNKKLVVKKTAKATKKK